MESSMVPVLWCVPTMRSGRSGVPRRSDGAPLALPLSVKRSELPMADRRLMRSPIRGWMTGGGRAGGGEQEGSRSPRFHTQSIDQLPTT